ncbi:MAG: cation:proton antiporter [Chloroflexi bacterium]|nr:cation:proton antiporter [Chloroflexota bacterium]
MGSLAIIIASALLGGLLAYRLKLPVLLGYIVAGILVGPYAFGLVEDLHFVETGAEIGVVLLMFTLGMEFSLADLKRVGKVGIGGGIAQILFTAALGFLAGAILFKWSTSDAMFFGMLISMSSTMIVLKILVERGETNSVHGRIMIAILLLQDLAVVPLIVVLPVLGQPASEIARALGFAMLRAAIFLAVIMVLGSWAVPKLLGRSAGIRSRELFMVTILAIALGSAITTSYFGVSEAFGAFAAGMLVSRSHFAHQALADVVPFRNIFAAIFFVSLGMLASPKFVVDNWPVVASVALLIILLKFVICGGIARYFGHAAKTVLFVGAGLAQVGEFSFVLGKSGLDAGVMSQYLYSLILSSAIVTVLLTPFLFKIADAGYARLVRFPAWQARLRVGGDGAVSEIQEALSGHVIVSGHGRTGGNLATVLRKYNVPYVVIELNPQIIAELRSSGVMCVYGDAGNPHILDSAQVRRARVLALTSPDPVAEIEATSYARRVNPDIDVLARLPEEVLERTLRDAGVSQIIEPPLEASLEFVRHILKRYGVSAPEVENLVCPFLREHEHTEADLLPKG